ncbi:predicted protein [Uncinocarpus reesii 1704]|uniref:Formyl transferase N-terminal domain-containing protein n=1 Tax=Uncinocarpus reesii (strain UAMH 1704) TaxID=336963 RepID=C4JJV9_UNCRE|nr:uncharacterized protein UREG_01916 [Uncinocarpus reesii 1704]EEP77067.1 predicted protein [Uncinocarpus reesii 1704]
MARNTGFYPLTRLTPALNSHPNHIRPLSFGLFIPPRILGAAKYGGLNIHPSLLPDFRGPAPIHHTLLAGEKSTGITLQTLHESRFDHGMILDQTRFDVPRPGSYDVQSLIKVAAEKGAEMLVNGIRNRLFVPPLAPLVQSVVVPESALRHAAKIRPEDRHIDWSSWPWDRIYRHHKVLGSLWNYATISETSQSVDPPLQKRIILTDLENIEPDSILAPLSSLEPGIPFAIPGDSSMTNKDRPLYVLTSDSKLVRINQIKVEGDKCRGAYAGALKAKVMGPLAQGENSHIQPISCFYAPLK